MDASKAFKKSRTTIYQDIKNGYLSRDNDGRIDLSELIRAYGNPVHVQASVHSEHVQNRVHVHENNELETVLKDQINLLKNQLELANQRERSLIQHIEDLTLRIEFKGYKEEKIEKPEVNQVVHESEPTHQQPVEDKRVEANISIQKNKEIKKKTSLLDRVVKAVFSVE